MAKMKLWHSKKGNTYKFIDFHVKNYFNVSGTVMNIHKYEGTYDTKGNFLKDIKIQDVLFMETTDRKYSENVYPLQGLYQMQDVDFEMSQYGFFSADTLMIDFHLNEMLDRIGRKLGAGDVIEVLHLRDDAVDNHEGGINAFYVIEEGKRTAEGYDPNWLPHVYRVRMKKLTDSREYQDIFDNEDYDDLSNMLSQYDQFIDNNEGIVDEAETEVPNKKIYTHDDVVYDYRYDGDEVVDQQMNIEDVPKGISFPESPEENEYFIRCDYKPKKLFQFINGTWVMTDYKFMGKWSRGHEYTDTYINNDNESVNNDKVVKEKTYITKPIKPEVDE